jgi:transposase InsO family protein
MGTTSIPQIPWKSISWDFIGPLPKSKDPVTGVEYDYLLVIMERLTKYMILVPCLTTMSAEDLANIYLREVVSRHGLSEEILSDRDKLFTSKFWTALTALLGAKRKMSTAFHPQTNGGNERINQVVEAYLRCYVNYQQTNWVQLLPLAQFAYNSSTTETTLVTPFYANFGYEMVAYREPGVTDVDNQSARIQVAHIKKLHKELAAELQFVAERNAHYYNKKRSQEPTLIEGDRVYLLRTNINTKRPSQKLDHKKLGPFKIKEVRGPLNYKLALPKTMNIHPVFHISLLELAPEGAPPAPLTEIEPVNPNAEYEVEEILDCRYVRNKIKYLIKWKDYPHSENTWEPKSSLNHLETLEEFHRQYLGLPATPGRTTDKARGRRQKNSHPTNR